MLKELKLLNNSRVVKDYKILDFKEGSNFYYLKIEATLIDDSKLYIKEHVSEEDYNVFQNLLKLKGILNAFQRKAFINALVIPKYFEKHYIFILSTGKIKMEI